MTSTAAPARPLRLAHASDLHLLVLSGLRLRQALGKRLTGLANLALFRRNAHPQQVAEALVERLAADDIDHVLISGDLSNLALDDELELALRLIERIGPPSRITVVPGNHDVYTAGALHGARFERWFAPYMLPIGTPGAETGAAAAAVREAGRTHYPFARQLGPQIRVYGLSSAVPMPAMVALGRVGGRQLRLLEKLVREEPPEVRARIVMLHHNLHRRGPVADRTARLLDREPLCDVLRRIDASLVLHGHTHHPQQHHLPFATDRAAPAAAKGASVPARPGIAVLGCGSSTWAGEGDRCGHFNLLEMDGTGLLAARSLAWSPAQGAFVPEHDDLLPRAWERALPW